jgi:hypothetical protein
LYKTSVYGLSMGPTLTVLAGNVIFPSSSLPFAGPIPGFLRFLLPILAFRASHETVVLRVGPIAPDDDQI